MRSLLWLGLSLCGGCMGFRGDRLWQTPCNRGINQQAELARVEECVDARNVWAPRGRVEQRPGYVGLYFYTPHTTDPPAFFAAATGEAYLRELSPADDDSYGTITGPVANVLTLSNLQALDATTVSDRWYIGASEKWWHVDIAYNGGNSNSNSTRMTAEYWNGSVWAPVYVTEDAGRAGRGPNHLTTGSVRFIFVPPQDWALGTVDGNQSSRYWIRFKLRDADIDANCALATASMPATQLAASTEGFYTAPTGLYFVQMPNGVTYIHTVWRISHVYDGYLPAQHTIALGILDAKWDAYGAASQQTFEGQTQPSTLASVPDFFEYFVSYAGRTVKMDPRSVSADTIVSENTWGDILATPDTSDAATGPGAVFDKTQVALESVWPHGNYVVFFDNRLWQFGLPDSPYMVRWSGRAPYHKVWPSLQYALLMEDDNSPITGGAPLGENLVLFKQDSIWIMVDQGIQQFDLRQYVPKKVVSGIGCVAQSSIQQIQGRLIFLAEDGLYAFDGVAAKKLSTRIQDTIDSITKPRRPWCASINWKSEGVYLLSVTTDGSIRNNTTIVWEYDQSDEQGEGSFWLWDNIDAQVWGSLEGANDEESLYFGDSVGAIYRFGVGRTDHGGTITAYLTTQRFGMETSNRKVLRSVEVLASNKTRSLTVEVLEDDADADYVPTGSGANGTIDYTDPSENDWTDFTWASGATTDDNWTAPRRRKKRTDFRRPFEWVQVKITHNTKDQPFELSQVVMRYLMQGER